MSSFVLLILSVFLYYYNCVVMGLDYLTVRFGFGTEDGNKWFCAQQCTISQVSISFILFLERKKIWKTEVEQADRRIQRKTIVLSGRGLIIKIQRPMTKSWPRICALKSFEQKITNSV